MFVIAAIILVVLSPLVVPVAVTIVHGIETRRQKGRVAEPTVSRAGVAGDVVTPTAVR